MNNPGEGDRESLSEAQLRFVESMERETAEREQLFFHDPQTPPPAQQPFFGYPTPPRRRTRTQRWREETKTDWRGHLRFFGASVAFFSVAQFLQYGLFLSSPSAVATFPINVLNFLVNAACDVLEVCGFLGVLTIVLSPLIPLGAGIDRVTRRWPKAAKRVLGWLRTGMWFAAWLWLFSPLANWYQDFLWSASGNNLVLTDVVSVVFGHFYLRWCWKQLLKLRNVNTLWRKGRRARR